MEFEFSMFQISAYVDNEFDVAALMEDAETKQAALDQVLGETENKNMFSNCLQSLGCRFGGRTGQSVRKINRH